MNQNQTPSQNQIPKQQNSYLPISSELGLSIKRAEFYLQLITVQNKLNQQLVINTGLMNTYMNITSNSKVKITSSDASTNPSLRNSNDGKNQKRPSKQKSSNIKQKVKNKKSKNKKSQDSDYEPQQSLENQLAHSKLSQTKNVPKNYGKAVFTFIKKEKMYIQRVLDNFSIPYGEFYSQLQNYKGKINTIAQLRSLWITKQNPYAKVMRIISMQYLRKYSLSHIFNSRVENYAKHIKYRYKIASGLERPEEFTQIKDF